MNEEVGNKIQSSKTYIKQKTYISIIVFLAMISSLVGQIALIDYFVSAAWIAVAFYLFNKEDFWLLFIPLSIFENTIFFFFTEFTVFKIFLLLSVVKLAISIFEENKMPAVRHIVVFLLLIGYALLNLRDFLPGLISLIICLLTIFMMCFSAYKMSDRIFFKKAMFGFAIFAIAAGVYGLLHGNSRVVSQNGVEMMRFCGTSSDPNIMSYKFILGMIALLYTDLIKRKSLKVVLEIFLLAMVFRTGSTTAILALGFVVIMVLLLQKSSLKKTLIVSLSAISVVVLLLNIDNVLFFLSDLKFLNLSTDRLLEQYYLFVGGDVSEATSLRTDIWDGYMDYFWNKQGIFSQLFGGNVTNIYAIEKNFAGMSWDAAAHSTTIDILMCVGIVGLLIIYYTSIKGLFQDIKLHRRKPEKVLAMRIIVKIITLFYALSLSMFLSYGFMIFLL